MGRLVHVAYTKELELTTMRRAVVEGEDILLCRVGENVYAVSNRCGHQNVNLSRGVLSGSTITCPLHQAKFELRTGECVAKPQVHLPDEVVKRLPPDLVLFFKARDRLAEEVEVKPLKTYRVVVEGEEVKIEM